MLWTVMPGSSRLQETKFVYELPWDPFRDEKAVTRCAYCYIALRYVTLRYVKIRYVKLRYVTLR